MYLQILNHYFLFVNILFFAPRIKYDFGISIKSKTELISYNKSIEDIKNEINADCLKYLTLEEMKQYMLANSYNHCFSGIIDPELIR